MRGRLSDGWLIVAGGALSFAVSAGLMHAFTVFFVAFLDEFGWSRADASLAYALSQLVNGVSAPLVGAAVDRYGPRSLVLGGSAILAVTLAASAYVSALWHLIVLYGVLMTLGASCLGLVVFTPVITRCFVHQRGMAIAVVQSASGVGRAVATPVVQALVLAYGWRQTYGLMAGCMVVLLLPLVWCIRTPREVLAPAKVRDAAVPLASPALLPDWRLSEAMGTLHFWLLFVVYLCTGLGSYFVSLHQLAFAADMGFDKLYAATVLGIGNLLTIGGIVAFGTISDYVGREVTGIAAYVVSILGVVCALGISSPADTWLLWLHACVFGVTWGTRGPIITAKCADLFQGRHLGTIVGVISIGSGLGSAIGTWAGGYIFDLAGDYRLAFWLSIASYVVGCGAFWLLRRPQRRQPTGRAVAPVRV